MILKIYAKTVFREKYGRLLKGLKILRAEINNIPVSIPVLMKYYKIDAKQLKVDFISYRFDYTLDEIKTFTFKIPKEIAEKILQENSSKSKSFSKESNE
jgi:hypothetical protein